MKLHYLLGAKCLLSRCLRHFFPWHTAYPAKIHCTGSSLSQLGGCIKNTQQLAVQRGVTVYRNSLHLIKKHTNTSNPSDFEYTWICWVNNPPILAPISYGTWTIQPYPTATPYLPNSSFPSPQALTLTEAHAQWSATYQHGKVSPVLQCVGKSEMQLVGSLCQSCIYHRQHQALHGYRNYRPAIAKLPTARTSKMSLLG